MADVKAENTADDQIYMLRLIITICLHTCYLLMAGSIKIHNYVTSDEDIDILNE